MMVLFLQCWYYTVILAILAIHPCMSRVWTAPLPRDATASLSHFVKWSMAYFYSLPFSIHCLSSQLVNTYWMCTVSSTYSLFIHEGLELPHDSWTNPMGSYGWSHCWNMCSTGRWLLKSFWSFYRKAWAFPAASLDHCPPARAATPVELGRMGRN